jgi:hypothetical protein
MLESPASATPVVLQYDVTTTTRCAHPQSQCLTVSICGLPLTLETDDTISSRETYPSETRLRRPEHLDDGHDGPRGFRQPSGGGHTFTSGNSYLGNGRQRLPRNHDGVRDQPSNRRARRWRVTRLYQVHTILGRGRDGVPDGVRPSHLLMSRSILRTSAPVITPCGGNRRRHGAVRPVRSALVRGLRHGHALRPACVCAELATGAPFGLGVGPSQRLADDRGGAD